MDIDIFNIENIKKYKETKESKFLENILKENEGIIHEIVRGCFSNFASGNGALEYEDLIQEGRIGMIIAVEKFDLSKDNRFITYAVFWVKQKVLRAIQNQSDTIRIPVYMKQMMSKFKKNNLDTKLTASDLKIKEDKLIKRIKAVDINVCSLDYAYDKDVGDCNLYQKLTYEEDVEENNIKNICLKEFHEELASILKEKELYVITKRMEGYKLEEIKYKFGVTRERIRQIEENAIEKMCKKMNLEKYRQLILD